MDREAALLNGWCFRSLDSWGQTRTACVRPPAGPAELAGRCGRSAYLGSAANRGIPGYTLGYITPLASPAETVPQIEKVVLCKESVKPQIDGIWIDGAPVLLNEKSLFFSFPAVSVGKTLFRPPRFILAQQFKHERR